MDTLTTLKVLLVPLARQLDMRFAEIAARMLPPGLEPDSNSVESVLQSPEFQELVARCLQPSTAAAADPVCVPESPHPQSDVQLSVPAFDELVDVDCNNEPVSVTVSQSLTAQSAGLVNFPAVLLEVLPLLETLQCISPLPEVGSITFSSSISLSADSVHHPKPIHFGHSWSKPD